MNENFKKEIDNLKKELTWNNTKVAISGLIPMGMGFWIYSQWFKILTPIINKYIIIITQNIPITPEHAVIVLCLMGGMIFPIWPLLLWTSYGGLWLGRVTKFYKSDKTRRIYFDGVSYFVRDMPQEQRDKIKELLLSYKSKIQLRKERLANKSWLRRTFT